MKEDPVNQLEAILAEYTWLRQECLQAIGYRITVMNFTFGALSVVLAGLLTGKVPPLVAGSIALFFVPQMAKAGLLIWLGEYDRSQRAGHWIEGLEARINQLTNSPGAMGWETTLATRGTHMGYPYIAIIVFMLGSGVAGSFLGLYFVVFEYLKHASVSERWLIVFALLAYIVAVEILFLRFFRARWRAIRTSRVRLQQPGSFC